VPSSVCLTKRRPWTSGVSGGRLRRLGVLSALVVAALTWTAASARAADPVIAAAADIACGTHETHFNGGLGTAGFCHELQTSNLLLTGGVPNVSAVLPVGDLQYECGGLASFMASYDPTWGRPALKAITHPVPGNHEYKFPADSPSETDCDVNGQAAGYFAYWGAQAGDPAKGYYSYNVGAWHLIALNTNSDSACARVGCRINSVQEKWLKKDLATHANACTLAYFHHPLFSSKMPVNAPRALWQDLYDAGAEIVLNGHVHSYERFAPQTPAGAADPVTGIREFVVGTGGRSLETFTAIAANSEVRGRAFGVLKLTLHPTSYDWQFVPDGTTGNTFTDSGTTACHSAPDRTPPTVTLTAPANGATVNGVTTISANAVDGVGVNRVDFLVDGKIVGTAATAPYSVLWNAASVTPGSHTVSARAFDTSGNQAIASVSVTVIPPLPLSPSGVRISSDIYRIRVNGAGLRRVTQAPVNVDYDSASWSRSGRRIAFSGPSCVGCPSAIFTILPGGAGQQQLPGTVPGAARPSWGRLDRALTFVGGPTNAVFTISSRGTGQRRLTSSSLGHDKSVFSHDGRQIAFTTQQRNGGWDILVMRANGTGKRNLTRTVFSEVQPAWSHDGRRIAFTRQVHGRSAIFVINTVGRPRVTFVAANCQQPTWSPNDRQIACTRFSATGSRIILMRSNGTRPRALRTGTITAWAPSWSPDGVRIAFTSAG
jgi:Tol biopolymer transport system component